MLDEERLHEDDGPEDTGEQNGADEQGVTDLGVAPGEGEPGLQVRQVVPLRVLGRWFEHGEGNDHGQEWRDSRELDDECHTNGLGEEGAGDEAAEHREGIDSEAAASDTGELGFAASEAKAVVDEGGIGAAARGLGDGPDDVVGEEHPVVLGEAEAEDGEGIEHPGDGEDALAADVVGEGAGWGLEDGDDEPEREVHGEDVLEFEAAIFDEVLDPDTEPEAEVHADAVRVVEAYVLAGTAFGNLVHGGRGQRSARLVHGERKNTSGPAP